MSIFILAIVIALTAAERLWPARREPTQPLANVALWLFRIFASGTVLTAFAVVLVNPLVAKLQLPSLHTKDWPPVLGFIAFFLLADFAAYAFHRAQHAIPFLWTRHQDHMLDPNMSALTTERHFWGDGFLAKAITQAPFLALVADPATGLCGGVRPDVGGRYFTHANLPISLGRWSWLINSPALSPRASLV